MFDLGKIIDVFVADGSTAAGTSTITSGEYAVPSDVDHILCLASIGTAASNNTLGINGATATGGSFSLMGTAIASDGTDALLVKEVKNNQIGFLKSVVTRGTSTTINLVIFIAYKKKSGASTINDWTTSGSYNLQVAPTLA